MRAVRSTARARERKKGATARKTSASPEKLLPAVGGGIASPKDAAAAPSAGTAGIGEDEEPAGSDASLSFHSRVSAAPPSSGMKRRIGAAPSASARATLPVQRPAI
jgi:hypothetical protein